MGGAASRGAAHSADYRRHRAGNAASGDGAEDGDGVVSGAAENGGASGNAAHGDAWIDLQN